MAFTLTPAYSWTDGDLVTAARLALTAVPTLAAAQTYAFGDGTAAAPSVTFNSDSDNGLYYVGANSFGLSCGGSSIGFFNTSGLQGCAVGATSASTGAFTTLTTSAGPIAIAMSAANPYLRFNGSAASQIWGWGDGLGVSSGSMGLYDVTNSKLALGVTPNQGAWVVNASSFTISGSFGCNGKAAQTAFASGGVLANVVTALINCGILSS